LCPEVDDENQVMFRGHDTPFAFEEQSSHSIGGNPIHLHPDLGSGAHTSVSASDRPTGVPAGGRRRFRDAEPGRVRGQ
jgi:hypothetical protein